MTTTRRPRTALTGIRSLAGARTRTVALAAVAAAAAGVSATLSAAPASATVAPTSSTSASLRAIASSAAASDPSALGQAIAKRLGAGSGGAYVDESGNAVITVVDSAFADQVEALGLEAEVVSHSASELAKVTSDLNAETPVPGTTWGTDVETNQVVLTVTPQASGQQLKELLAEASEHGSAVRVERSDETLRPLISGGDAIYRGGARCSLGFNVTNGTDNFFVTAGHCGTAGSSWFANCSSTTALGPMTGSSFPGNDYAIVRYSNTTIAKPSAVGTQAITSAANPTVGQSACRRGSTTGLRCGSVTALNATVVYAQGSVTGMIRTNICAEPGDSGGSLYSGTVALGLTSGGSGNCTSGGTTFFQPVVEALSVYGVSIPGAGTGPNLAVNGSFEQPDLPAGYWNVYNSIPGWTAVGAQPIEIQDHAWGGGEAADGQQIAEMDSYGSTTFQQSLPTTAGKTYRIRLSYSPRPGYSTADNKVNVSWNGVQLAQLVADGTGRTATAWSSYTATVTVPAGSTSSQLRLADAGVSNGVGMLVDAVTVNQVY